MRFRAKQQFFVIASCLAVVCQGHRAQGTARVHTLDIRACSSGESGQSLLQAIRIELAEISSVVLHESGQAPSSTRKLVLTQCHWDQGELVVNLINIEHSSPIARKLDLSDVPKLARIRTAAVALVEWARVLNATAPPEGPERQGSREAPSPKAPAKTASLRASKHAGDTPPNDQRNPLPAQKPQPKIIWETTIGLQLQGKPVLLGTHLAGGLSTQLYQQWHASFALRGTFAQTETTLGDAQFLWLGADAALGYALGKEANLSFWGVLGLAQLFARGISSLNVRESTLHRRIGTGSVRVKARVVLTQSWSTSLVAEAGLFLNGVRLTAGGEEAVRLSGPFGVSAIQLGYGF